MRQHKFFTYSEGELELLKQEWINTTVTQDFLQKYNIGYRASAKLFGKKGYKRSSLSRSQQDAKRENEFNNEVEKRFKIIEKKFGISKRKIIKLLTKYTFTEIYNAKDINNIKDLIIF